MRTNQLVVRITPEMAEWLAVRCPNRGDASAFLRALIAAEMRKMEAVSYAVAALDDWSDRRRPK